VVTREIENILAFVERPSKKNCIAWLRQCKIILHVTTSETETKSFSR